ncbi:MAG: ATP-binding cassette domain-containing protein [Tessaracoccus sp.]|uniref:ABC transporter ATP-binding protein n=1 Tax=Tessaracoccus sp. TaxID=1971211 RepID=UPI001EC3437C|nr:ATP-binding cassette domain-containing protein [Tessaracoccus sp.]MBK7820741.1 ATP-binding cassette domain-containing protein [Tessaracoccus sp.]
MSSPSPSVTVREVTHRYGRRVALADATLDLPVGVTGLLGPNGAGKSTLMKLIATAMPLQSGCVAVGELPLVRDNLTAVRAQLGYLPQRFELMGWSTVRRNVEYAAWAHGLPSREAGERADCALALLGLSDRASSRARALSGGMRQRLGLACALVHEPRVLILDEPTVGLDPAQRRGLRDAIAAAAERAVVLISTHLVEDLATLADQVVVMHEGALRFVGTLDDLRALGADDAAGHASVLEAGYHAVVEGHHG